MKLEEFIKLPAGTIYKKNSGGGLLEIKGGWVSDDGNDWSSDLFAADCKDDQDTHTSQCYTAKAFLSKQTGMVGMDVLMQTNISMSMRVGIWNNYD